jgi:hypothetical protein
MKISNALGIAGLLFIAAGTLSNVSILGVVVCSFVGSVAMAVAVAYQIEEERS